MRMISAGLAAMVFGGVSTGCNTKDFGKWDNITFAEPKKIPFEARGAEAQALLEKLGRAPKKEAKAGHGAEGHAAEKAAEKATDKAADKAHGDH